MGQPARLGAKGPIHSNLEEGPEERLLVDDCRHMAFDWRWHNHRYQVEFDDQYYRINPAVIADIKNTIECQPSGDFRFAHRR